MPSRISLTLLVCILGAAVAVGALFLPPRSSSPSSEYSPPPTNETAGGRAAVSIADFSFTAVGTLIPGQEVIVTNDDSVPHTLTADDGSFDTGLLQPGEQASIVMPTSPGEFSFFCEVHPSMTGAFAVSA